MTSKVFGIQRSKLNILTRPDWESPRNLNFFGLGDDKDRPPCAR